MGGAEAILVLLLPMVTALAYGVVRSARPTPRLEPETAPDGLTPAAAGEVPQQSSGMQPEPAARYQGSVIAVGILSTIVFLSVSFVAVLALFGAIRTLWNTFPAGTSQDIIGTANIALVFFSMFLGVPASVIAIVVGHVTLLILRRIPHRPEGKAPGRVVLTVLLVASVVTAYLAVAMQIFYGVHIQCPVFIEGLKIQGAVDSCSKAIGEPYSSAERSRFGVMRIPVLVRCSSMVHMFLYFRSVRPLRHRKFRGIRILIEEHRNETVSNIELAR